jgi:flagellar protein FliO/FliZ
MNASFAEITLRMLLALGAIVAVIALIAWCARRFGLAPAVRREHEDSVRILSRTALDARKSVVVLSVRGRVLVVGVTPSEISLLTELSGETAAHAEPAPSLSFSARLSRALSESGILPNAH